MKKQVCRFALAAMVLVSGVLGDALAAEPAAAPEEGKGPNVSATPGKEGQNSPGLSENAMAQQLVRYGIGRKDPLPLITAAKIMKQNPVTVENRTKTTEIDKTAQDPSAGGDDEKATLIEDITTPEGVLAKAKALAGDKNDILAMIDSVASYNPPKTRGRVGGPTRHYDRVRRYSIDIFPVRFRGMEEARISVQGDGDSNLDCYIYDGGSNLVDADTNFTDSCDLNWTPSWTSTFYLKIVNRGRSSNRYILFTN